MVRWRKIAVYIETKVSQLQVQYLFWWGNPKLKADDHMFVAASPAAAAAASGDDDREGYDGGQVM